MNAALLAWLACRSSMSLPMVPVTEHAFEVSLPEAPLLLAITFDASGVAARTSRGITLSLPDRRWGEPSLLLVAGEADGDFAHQRKLPNGATLRYNQEQTIDERLSTSLLSGELTLEGHRLLVECHDYREAEDGADALGWCGPWLGTLRRVEPKP